MFQKDPKIALAEEFEKKAHNQEIHSKGRYLPEHRRPTHGQISDAYKEAGDLWKEAGDFYRARKCYNLAIKNAYNKRIENLLRDKIEKLDFSKEKGLVGILKSKFVAVSSIMCFLGALFFLSFNLTGFVIGNLAYNDSNLISTSLFLLGLVFAFFYFRRK